MPLDTSVPPLLLLLLLLLGSLMLRAEADLLADLFKPVPAPDYKPEPELEGGDYGSRSREQSFSRDCIAAINDRRLALGLSGLRLDPEVSFEIALLPKHHFVA